MLITLRPGVNRENLLNALQSVYTDVFNLRAGGGPGRTAHDRLLAYIEWTNSAVRMLDGQISSEDLDRLVLTDRYRLLVSGSAVSLTGTDVQVQRAVNEWVSLELDARVAGFEAVIKELQGRIARWSGDEHCVVPDTSFYIHHPDKLQDIDLGAVTYDRLADFVVLMPMVIVDELDRLKESKDRHVRWRASYTLALLDRCSARARDGSSSGRSRQSQTRTGGRRAKSGSSCSSTHRAMPGCQSRMTRSSTGH